MEAKILKWIFLLTTHSKIHRELMNPRIKVRKTEDSYAIQKINVIPSDKKKVGGEF